MSEAERESEKLIRLIKSCRLDYIECILTDRTNQAFKDKLKNLNYPYTFTYALGATRYRIDLREKNRLTNQN